MMMQRPDEWLKEGGDVRSIPSMVVVGSWMECLFHLLSCVHKYSKGRQMRYSVRAGDHRSPFSLYSDTLKAPRVSP